jgi:hypothetical protein
MFANFVQCGNTECGKVFQLGTAVMVKHVTDPGSASYAMQGVVS